MINWFQKAQSCSPESQVFAYCLVACAILVASGGVFFWFRFIKSKPGKNEAQRFKAMSLSELKSNSDSNSPPIRFYGDGV
jgi:hypothetical protein